MINNPAPKKIVFYSMFLAAGLIVTVPAFKLGMIISDDVLVHLNWHRMFYAQLLDGQWYPRWLMDMNGGRGSPVFFYYPPLPYFVSAVIEWFLPSGANRFAALYLSFGLALGLSGIACYRLLVSYVRENVAVVFALFYVVAPYHLFINFYHRFAYAETWALAWTPLLFVAIDDVIERKKSFKLLIVTALLLCTHLPTVIMLTIPVLAYIAVNAGLCASTGRILLQVLCGVAAAAFYVVPMLSYYGYVGFDRMWQGKHYIHNNYLLSHGGFNNDYYLVLAIMHGLAFAIITIILMYQYEQKILFWLGLGFLSILLMFDVSYIFWQYVPLYKTIQFPWRLNQLVLLSLTVLSAIVFSRKLHSFKMYYQYLLAFICVAFLLSTVKNISSLSARELTADESVRVTNSIDANLCVVEYLPRWVSDQTIQKVREFKLDHLPKVIKDDSNLTVEIVKWQPGHVTLQTMADADTTVSIRQFYFPNWQATIDEGINLTILSDAEGLMKFNVPAGMHTIKIEFAARYPELIGGVVSVLALIFLCLSICREKLMAKQHKL